VLVVDGQEHAGQRIAEMLNDDQLVFAHAGTLAEAREQIGKGRVDLALIDPDLPDGCGLELARELGRARRCSQTILLTDNANVEQTVAAMRLGVSDLVTKPLDACELTERVKMAIHRQASDLDDRRKVRKLQKMCKQLDAARQEVSEQVDVLCNDLVTAYQELAMQMQQVVQTSEYTGIVRDELDLECLLRRTLEFIAQKAGPTNAALFLPATADEYTLGGYVNYDCSSDSADILLQHLADVIAPRVADRDAPVHLTDNETISQWLDGDAAYLADSHIIGIAASHEGEVLAVLVLFRDGTQPFDTDLVETLSGIAPMLGEYLARIIRVHHRHIPDSDFEDEDGELMF
jgi:DNA-binding response OmpR family regulator